jgi:hypothetical protein
MSVLSIQPTYPIFTDSDGQPLENGYVWIGAVNLDPQVNPINVYWDADLTILAAQPIRTLAGYPSNSGTPARLYVNGNYSIRVMDKKGSMVYSAPSATERYDGGVISNINASQVLYDPAGTGAVQTTVQTKLREYVSVKDFGATGDGITDDTAAIQAAIMASAGANKLIFPRGTYRFSSPLTIGDIDVDFQKSILRYAGPVGNFALTLFSSAGAGINQRNGNRFSDFTLSQNDWTEYVTRSASITFDPSPLANFANITNINPNALSTTVSVPGARVGGYARATFSSLAVGCVVTAAVTADDVVTVWFNNYNSAVVNMPSGTLSVNVVNNAYHGLCLNGSLGTLENAKVIGFTGVSMAVGAGREQITGVDFPGAEQCYYWKIQANVAPAAGWGIVVKPRNNENTFNLSLFPINAYNDPFPRRACCINQVVMSGVTNGIDALSLESVSSEAALLITDAATTITSSKVIYYESNQTYAIPPAPYIHAKPNSAGCSLQSRLTGAYQAILDEGVANDIKSVMSFYINGRQVSKPEGGQNLVYNGDFLNGTRGWSNFSSGTSAVTIPGDGYLSGKRARVDVTSGRINLQQAANLFGPFNSTGLIGKTVTAGAWLKTNVFGMQVRVNGLANVEVPADEKWYFSSVTIRINTSNIDISIIDNRNLTQTGYVEISNVSCVIGTRAFPINVPTMPIGSKTYNPPSILNGQSEITTVTVPGAEFGDFAVASFDKDLQGIELSAYVSAVDTVSCVFRNDTGGTIDLASGTLRCRLSKV